MLDTHKEDLCEWLNKDVSNDDIKVSLKVSKS